MSENNKENSEENRFTVDQKRRSLLQVGAGAGTVAMYPSILSKLSTEKIAEELGEDQLLPAVPVAVAVGKGLLAGGAGFMAGYGTVEAAEDLYNKYFGGGERNLAESTTLEDSHADLISVSSYMQNSVNDFDNDLNQFEGELEQYLTREIIKNSADFTSESEFNTIVDNKTSDFIWSNYQNIREVFNFASIDIKTIQDKLETVNAGNDIGAIKTINVDSEEDLPIDENTSTIININSDLNINADNYSDINIPVIRVANNSKVNLNGNTITINNNTNNSTSLIQMNNSGIFNGGNGKIEQIGGFEDRVIFLNSGNFNLRNVTIIADNSINHIVGEDYQTSSSLYTNNVTYKNTGSDSEVSLRKIGLDLSTTEFNIQENIKSITFDPSSVTANTTVTVGETKYTAVEIPSSSSYVPSDAPSSSTKLIMPYTTSGGLPLNEADLSLVANTDTSGTNPFVTVLNYNKLYDLFTERDNIASTSFTDAQNWATDIWQNNFAGVDDPASVIDSKEINQELGNFQYGDLDPNNPREVNAIYSGNYENIKQPYDTTQTYEIVSSGEQVTGNLYSTDFNAIVFGTSDPTVVAEGDVLDTDSVTSFIIKDSDGSKINLSSDVEVISLTRPDNDSLTSVEYRDFDFSSTDLSQEAAQLQEKRDAVTTLINDGGAGGGGGLNIDELIQTAGIVAVILAALRVITK